MYTVSRTFLYFGFKNGISVNVKNLDGADAAPTGFHSKLGLTELLSDPVSTPYMIFFFIFCIYTLFPLVWY